MKDFNDIVSEVVDGLNVYHVDKITRLINELIRPLVETSGDPLDDFSKVDDDVLNELSMLIECEKEYRKCKKTTPPPGGYEVIHGGESIEGDLKWCGKHELWEKVEDPGTAYWAYNLIARKMKRDND